jgi:hypothetical protein
MPPKEKRFPNEASVEQLHNEFKHQREQYLRAMELMEGKDSSTLVTKATAIASGERGRKENTEGDAGRTGSMMGREDSVQTKESLEPKLDGECDGSWGKDIPGATWW